MTRSSDCRLLSDRGDTSHLRQWLRCWRHVSGLGSIRMTIDLFIGYIIWHDWITSPMALGYSRNRWRRCIQTTYIDEARCCEPYSSFFIRFTQRCVIIIDRGRKQNRMDQLTTSHSHAVLSATSGRELPGCFLCRSTYNSKISTEKERTEYFLSFASHYKL